jgi:CubicO group peptidase (beta-lactamase class C family)
MACTARGAGTVPVRSIGIKFPSTLELDQNQLHRPVAQIFGEVISGEIRYDVSSPDVLLFCPPVRKRESRMDIRQEHPYSAGEYRWGGAAGTAFWIDPKEQMVVVWMTQAQPGPRRGEDRDLFRQLVQGAIAD